MVNNVRVIADHGRYFHPLADHMTKLRYSPRVKFGIFQRSNFHLTFDQTLSNFIVCLMISHTKIHTKVAQTS